jgi:hypothetical protein
MAYVLFGKVSTDDDPAVRLSSGSLDRWIYQRSEFEILGANNVVSLGVERVCLRGKEQLRGRLGTMSEAV